MEHNNSPPLNLAVHQGRFYNDFQFYEPKFDAVWHNTNHNIHTDNQSYTQLQILLVHSMSSCAASIACTQHAVALLTPIQAKYQTKEGILKDCHLSTKST